MKPGLAQTDGWRYMQEMLPLVKDLWQGDVEHDGEYWAFPKATSCPKPVQKDVPIWVAARSPITFDYAVENDCNIMSWPLTKGFEEVELYRTHLDAAIAKSDKPFNGTFAMMRHTGVYNDDAHKQATIDAVRSNLSKFGNLMMKSGDVVNGFPDEVSLSSLEGNAFVDPNMLEENLMFGTPDQVIEKLKKYEAVGVDTFIYYASMGLGQAEQQKSMELFCSEVMPAFE
jgi:alkanesulfonate monooxygenase SsuD/methylene tetrahydromethanopterin reductase-like flavin-dependent oxidoreductase (luciferase family)